MGPPILLIVLMVGIGLPLLGLLIAKKTGAAVAGDLFGQVVAITIVGTGVEREGRPFALRKGDFLEPVANGGTSFLTVGPVSYRVEAGFNPFGEGRVIARGTSGCFVASSTKPKPVGRDHHAVLPVALNNTWVLLVDPSDTSGAATLVMLQWAGSSEAQTQDLVGSILDLVPPAYERIKAAVDKS